MLLAIAGSDHTEPVAWNMECCCFLSPPKLEAAHPLEAVGITDQPLLSHSLAVGSWVIYLILQRVQEVYSEEIGLKPAAHYPPTVKT